MSGRNTCRKSKTTIFIAHQSKRLGSVCHAHTEDWLANGPGLEPWRRKILFESVQSSSSDHLGSAATPLLPTWAFAPYPWADEDDVRYAGTVNASILVESIHFLSIRDVPLLRGGPGPIRKLKIYSRKKFNNLAIPASLSDCSVSSLTNAMVTAFSPACFTSLASSNLPFCPTNHYR